MGLVITCGCQDETVDAELGADAGPTTGGPLIPATDDSGTMQTGSTTLTGMGGAMSPTDSTSTRGGEPSSEDHGEGGASGDGGTGEEVTEPSQRGSLEVRH